MGREHELLEAARSGNVSVIEKLLNPRKKLTVGSLPLSLGPLSRLGRTMNPNCQDQNGDTPIHLAALNGHIEVVKMLLRFEASVNVMDNKGCYPLHLAAWSGNAEMCNVLLSHGPSLAKVNEQNYCGETALHCAAQYGHTATVAVLLPHLADPLIRNDHSETPLDLASQYGRLDTVELLIRKCPGLIADHTEALSPLHLASRNGHRGVVQFLLEAGYDVNKTTDSGTALHEASIFGKQEVVRLLLRKGINASLTDSTSRTVLEVLSEHKSQLSLDIGRIILDYLEGRSISDKRSSTQSASSDPLEPIYDRPVHDIDVLIGGERRLSARSSGDSTSVFSTGARYSTTSESYFLYDTPKGRPIPPGLDEVDAISDTSGSPASATGGLSSLSSLTPSIAICNSGSISSRSPQGTPPIATPETPKKPPRRKPPSQVISVKPRGPSPPRMVFINKRPSTTSSRDSTGSVTEKSGNNDNNNAPVSAPQGNNNVAGAKTTTSTQYDNDNNLKCDINNLQQGAATVTKDDNNVVNDDVTNFNHQVSSSSTTTTTVLTTTTARDSLEAIEEVKCSKTRESRLETTTTVVVDNDNNQTTDSNLNIDDADVVTTTTATAKRRSKRSANKEDSDNSDNDDSSGNSATSSCTRSFLCRDSLELVKAPGKGSGGVGCEQGSLGALRSSCEVEVVEGPTQPVRLSEYDRESFGHVTLV